MELGGGEGMSTVDMADQGDSNAILGLKLYLIIVSCL